jgi:hypothetical protein
VLSLPIFGGLHHRYVRVCPRKQLATPEAVNCRQIRLWNYQAIAQTIADQPPVARESGLMDASYRSSPSVKPMVPHFGLVRASLSKSALCDGRYPQPKRPVDATRSLRSNIRRSCQYPCAGTDQMLSRSRAAPGSNAVLYDVAARAGEAARIRASSRHHLINLSARTSSEEGISIGRRSGAASLPDYKPASQTPANEINRATGVQGPAPQVGNVTLIHASARTNSRVTAATVAFSSHGWGDRCDLWLSALTMIVSVAVCTASIPTAP